MSSRRKLSPIRISSYFRLGKAKYFLYILCIYALYSTIILRRTDVAKLKDVKLELGYKKCTFDRDVTKYESAHVKQKINGNLDEQCLNFVCSWDVQQCHNFPPTNYAANEPPCCTHILRDMTRQFDEVMCDLGLDYAVFYGGLVELVLSNGGTPSSIDNEFIVSKATIAAMVDLWESSSASPGLALISQGLYRICVTSDFANGQILKWENNVRHKKMIHENKYPYIDIYSGKVEGGEWFRDGVGCCHKLSATWPSVRKKVYNGAFYQNFPAQPEAILNGQYGINWTMSGHKRIKVADDVDPCPEIRCIDLLHKEDALEQKQLGLVEQDTENTDKQKVKAPMEYCPAYRNTTKYESTISKLQRKEQMGMSNIPVDQCLNFDCSRDVNKCHNFLPTNYTANERPCCTHILRDMTRQFDEVMCDLGLDYAVFYGGLLELTRSYGDMPSAIDNQFIVSKATIAAMVDLWESSSASPGLTLFFQGVYRICVTSDFANGQILKWKNKMKHKKRIHENKYPYIDIYSGKVEGGEWFRDHFNCCHKLSATWPSVRKKVYNGAFYQNFPAQPEAILHGQYGSNWRVSDYKRINIAVDVDPCPKRHCIDLLHKEDAIEQKQLGPVEQDTENTNKQDIKAPMEYCPAYRDMTKYESDHYSKMKKANTSPKQNQCLNFDCSRDVNKCHNFLPTNYTANEPPCCTHILRDMTRQFDDVMCELGLDYTVFYGGLLELARSNGGIPSSIHNEFIVSKATIAAMVDLWESSSASPGLALISRGIYRICVTSDFANGQILKWKNENNQPIHDNKYPYIDIYSGKVEGGEWFRDGVGCCHKLSATWPSVRRKVYNGAFYQNFPAQPEAILSDQYGSNWRNKKSKKTNIAVDIDPCPEIRCIDLLHEQEAIEHNQLEPVRNDTRNSTKQEVKAPMEYCPAYRNTTKYESDHYSKTKKVNTSPQQNRCLNLDCSWDINKCDNLLPTNYAANERPCCTHILRDMTRQFDDVMCELGLDYTVFYGGLLGFVRSDRLIPWSIDNDMLVTKATASAMVDLWESSSASRGLRLFFQGVYRICITSDFANGQVLKWRNKFAHKKLIHDNKYPYIDIYSGQVVGGEWFGDDVGCCHKLSATWPSVRKKVYNGAFYQNFPANPITILRDKYGDNWKIPDGKKHKGTMKSSDLCPKIRCAKFVSMQRQQRRKPVMLLSDNISKRIVHEEDLDKDIVDYRDYVHANRRWNAVKNNKGN